MMSADLIRGPVGQVLALIVWLVVFSLLIGAINGWYLQSVDAGTISGERFDRIVGKVTGDTGPDQRWGKVTSVVSVTGTGTTLDTASAHKIEDSSGSCHVAGLADTGITAATAYTPIGTEVAVNESGNIPGCEFSPAGSVFNAGGLGGLVEIVLQAAGLAPPIALLFALGSFGTSFMRNMGSHPILAAVLTVIMLLLVATLLNTFVPFLTAAFEAIDKNRFIMYDEGLGAISTVVGNFYGVVVVSSMMMIAWQVIKHLRGGGNVISEANSM